MRLLAEKLEAVGLEKFINKHRLILCERTLSQNKIAAALRFDADQISAISQPAASYSRNEKLYELIEKKSTVLKFLEALKHTRNDHVIGVIRFLLANPSRSSQTFSSSCNEKTGIWFNVTEPFDSFCGREDFLFHLHNILQRRADSMSMSMSMLEVPVLPQVVVISSHRGGIGKTETVRRYMMKYEKFYSNFIWIKAEAIDTMKDSFEELANEIQIPITNSDGYPRKFKDMVPEIYDKICAGEKPSLFVFDNAGDYQSCQRYFPSSLHPSLTKPVILATSRNHKSKWTTISTTGTGTGTGKVQVLPLDVFSADESLDFMRKQLKIPDSGISEFKEKSKEFIKLMGGIPLALQQAVAHIKEEKELSKFLEHPYEISDYVQEFKSSMKRVRSLFAVPVEAPDSSTAIYAAFNVTLGKLPGLQGGADALHRHQTPSNSWNLSLSLAVISG